jgi:formylglycine-generating enzyme required for sulfatase activity
VIWRWLARRGVRYLWLLASLLVAASGALAMTVREFEPIGAQPWVLDENGTKHNLYKASYALLISESGYLGVARQGWKRLEQTGIELDQVGEVLRAHGFRVRRVSDASGSELQTAIQEFLGKYGREADHRLLIFFSGHGYTDAASGMGYLVPVDAADPKLNPAGFYGKALPIESLQTSAKTVLSRHAMFIFDSCFSGSIFMSKSDQKPLETRGTTVSDRWAFLMQKAAKPVRQFIAAGGSDEELPANSDFVPLFIAALEGEGSKVRDGYVTGKEIGFWLEQYMPRFNKYQNPHSDVIRDPRYVFGDMVFQLTGRKAASSIVQKLTPNESETRGPMQMREKPPVSQTGSLVPLTKLSTPPTTAPPDTARPIIKDCDFCPELIVIPRGSFMMGSATTERERKSDEGLIHRVEIGYDLAVGRYEVKQGEWRAIMGNNPSRFSACGDDCPVEQITWYEIQLFLEKLNQRTGKVYRLLSESEWEYAAHAGTVSPFSTGNILGLDQANFDASASYNGSSIGQSRGKTTTAGAYLPNPFGLHDMHGNVWEWVQDRYHTDYEGAPADGSAWESGERDARVLRGGSWMSPPADLRAARRAYKDPNSRSPIAGFRVVRLY